MDDSRTSLKKRILVVDNTSHSVNKLVNYLRELGYEANGIVTTGEGAVLAALHSDPTPDLLVIEGQLNGQFDGVETARQINQRRDIPVVYLLTSVDKELLERANQTYLYGYLFKPVCLSKVATTVELALSQHHLRRSLQHKIAALRARVDFPVGKSTGSY